MGLMFDCLLTDFAVLLATVIAAAIFYFKYSHNHWTRHCIPQIKPSLPFGNVADLVLRRESPGIVFQKFYEHFKSLKLPYGGVYFMYKPEFFLTDPELIKCILIKDFHHFTDRGLFSDGNHDPLSAHLFALDGAKWKTMRTKLTPTFTSGKMKMMFHTMIACSNELSNILNEKTQKSEPLNIKNILARFTTDVIGSCGFGIDCNSLKDPDNEFLKYGVASFEPQGFDMVRQLAGFVSPAFVKLINMKVINKNVTDFFMGVVKDTVKYREENNVFRKDFMHLLLQLKNQGKLTEDDGSIKGSSGKEIGMNLTIEEIAAQCFVFFLAGFETSSTTMTFCLYELVSNPDIQEKLREEINTVLKKHKELTYDAIMEMHYLDKVINETLRKFPPLPFLIRRCNQEYKLPNVNYTFKKGSVVRISTLGLQRDPEYYPDPMKFDPERFSEEEKAKRPTCTFMPFGDGPRNCIGLRFGLMQTKVGLCTLLQNYKFTLNSKTSTPLVMDPNSFIMSTKGGIWLDAHKVVA